MDSETATHPLLHHQMSHLTTTWKSGALCILLSASLIGLSERVGAQDYERIAPRTPASNEIDELPANSRAGAEAADTDNEMQLLPKLKGLVFVSRPADVRVAGRPSVSGVLVDGVEMMDQNDWSQRLASRIGAPLTMGGLQQILREVIEDYNRKGRPVVDVVVLEQEITSGVIQLAVVEAHVGEIRAEGAKWFKNERLSKQVRLEPGGPIDSTLLLGDLRWLNNNPFRSVDLVYSPGQTEGETDVVLKVEDRFPMRVYVGAENTGNTLSGDNRWYAGINYGNLWGIDHQINYQWTFNEDVDLLSAHALSYVAPLPWRHTASIHAAYVQTQAELPAPFNLDGETAQISGRYNIPLPGIGKIEHELEFGYDFKYSTSNLEFGVLTALATATDIHQFVAGYRMNMRGNKGVTNFSAFTFLSPGDFGGGNSDAAYGLSRFGADSSYAYGVLSAERLQQLPRGFTLALRATGQVSDSNLLPSEQLGLGGYASVRGYEEHEWNVDRGYLLAAELRAPSIPLSKIPLFKDDQAGELQLLMFVDRGGGHSAYRLPGEIDEVSMSSIGPGLRMTVGEHFSMRFDYGFQLEDSGAGAKQGNSRAHLGAMLSW